MSSDATADTEMHRTDELSGGGSKTARVVSQAAEQVLHSEGQQVATQRHPSLEDVPSGQASHLMASSAPGRSGAVPEPRTLRWWSAMLVVLLGWWAALTAAVARLLGAHAWRQRGAQPGLQAAGASAAAAPAGRAATRRSRPAAAQPLAFKVADEPSGSDHPDTLPGRSRSDGAAPSSQDVLQGSGRLGATAGSPQPLRQAVLARAQLGQPPLTWSESASNWLSGRRAGRATAGSSPLPSVSSWQALYSRRRRDSSLSEPDPHSHSHASVAALLDVDLGQDEVLRETATALRQAGHAAHEALAQVQHVLHDTPDAAAEVAGSIMGRPNYHHQAPKHAPAAPAAPPTTGGRLRRPPPRTWSDRLISHLSQPHPSQPPRTLARDSYDSTTARRLGFTEAGAVAGEQLSPQRPKSGLWEGPAGPHQEFGAEDMGGDASCMVAAGPQARLVEGLRTAQQAFKNPHAASVQLAGRMLGKGNYGHA